jgi:hypothetical protein
MLAVAFDTLKLARKLESAGVQPKQAQDMSAALAETLTEWHSVGYLATKDDVREVKVALQVQMAETKSDILKWMFAAIGAQTFILLAALFGLLHSVVKF